MAVDRISLLSGVSQAALIETMPAFVWETENPGTVFYEVAERSLLPVVNG